jgi:hypothetical protein
VPSSFDQLAEQRMGKCAAIMACTDFMVICRA